MSTPEDPLYGYTICTLSSRKLKSATCINLEAICLMHRLHPDFKTISDFCREYAKVFKAIFR